MKKTLFPVLTATLLLCSCHNEKSSQVELMNPSDFEINVAGKETGLYTLSSETGITMQVTNFGSRIVSLWTPDRNGKLDDIVLGHRTINEYINYEGERFIGCVVGRYANRIANGEFRIDDETYHVPQNNNGQSLHGGLKGLDQVVWNVDSVTDNAIALSYFSQDGEEGYPGNLNIKMRYAIENNDLIIEYRATTDKATVVNLSHHGFFNLKGEGNGSTNDHILMINADSITPVNNVLIPLGELMSVTGTPFDFRQPTAIGDRIDMDDEQLKNGNGYDHNWVLNRKTSDEVELAATVYDPTTGRLMEVYTNQPGLQFYSGNFFNGEGNGKYGATMNYREAIALETQKFPDSPNHPQFPSTLLNPGEEYTHICIYRFLVNRE